MKGSQAYFEGRAAGRIERQGGGMQRCKYDQHTPQGREWLRGWWEISGVAPAAAVEAVARPHARANDNAWPVRHVHPADRPFATEDDVLLIEHWLAFPRLSALGRIARTLRRTEGQLRIRLNQLRVEGALS